MKIAVILPSLANKGPILVAKDLCGEFVKQSYSCKVFYFDDICEVEFPCPTQRISFIDNIDLSSFDVVHSHMFRPDLYLCLYKLRHKKAPVISTVHQHIGKQFRFSDSSKPLFYFLKWIWFIALRQLNLVVTLNDSHKSYYMGKRINAVTIFNGRDVDVSKDVDCQDVQLLQNFKERFTVLGSIAYVTKRKGLDQIINVLPLIPKCGFLLVGDGPEVDKLKELAKLNGVEDRCLFLGSRSDGYRYLKYIDVFALTSYAEGFPLSLIESFAYGVPAVCSKLDEITSVLSASDVKYYDLNDIQSLLNNINLLINDYPLARVKARELYEGKFSSIVMAEKYLDIYNHL